MADVVCMGELLVDFVSMDRNAPLSAASRFLRAPGGAPANVAVAVKRLGLSARFVGKVGRDPFGDFLRETLDATGVDMSFLLVDPLARTTAAFAGVWDDGRKEFFFYRNPGADMMLAPGEVAAEMLSGARCFHFGSIAFTEEPAASAQRKALDLARAAGLMITYDPNYRPSLWPDKARAREVIRDSFRFCHLAKVSDEEWEVASGHRDLDKGVDAILSRGVELLVISRGANGAMITNGDWREERPAWSVDCVEPTGAGDAFLAAMIVRLLPERERLGSLARVARDTARQALDYANAAGALTCTRPGAIPSLPTAPEVDEFWRRCVK